MKQSINERNTERNTLTENWLQITMKNIQYPFNKKKKQQQYLPDTFKIYQKSV